MPDLAVRLDARRRRVAAVARPRSLGKPTTPRAVEMQYVKALRSVVRSAGRQYIDDVLAAARAELPEPARQDARGLRAILAAARARVRDFVVARIKAGILEGVMRAVNAANLRDLSRVLGLDRTMLAPDLGAEVLSGWQRENVELITNATAEFLDQAEAVVANAIDSGARVESLAADLQERLGVAESRANLIARDQVLKANSQLSEARMQRVGITRYRWSTSKDQRVRDGHAALEGREFRFADPPVVDPATGRRANPGIDFQCLPAHEFVRVAHGVRRAFRRPVSGQELVLVVTSEGRRLEVTPNHPVLTGSGWKPAHALHVGDDVFGVGGESFLARDEHEEHGPPTIEEVFEALALVGFRERVAASGPQFHGDMTDGEVEVVCVDGVLARGFHPVAEEEARKLLLADADSASHRLRESVAVGVALGLPSHGIMGRARETLALLWRCVRHPDEHGTGATAQRHARALQVVGDRLALDAVSRGESLDADALRVQAGRLLAVEVLRVVGWTVDVAGDAPSDDRLANRFLVEADAGTDLPMGSTLAAKRERVIELGRREHAGHVFNLETATGWYASELVVHNCRCVAIPILDDD